MRLGFDLWIRDFRIAIGDLGGSAVAMVNSDDFRDMVQCIEAARLSQNAFCQSLNAGATTPIEAPAMTNWLYLPSIPRLLM
jgi:hypothetical protein